MAKQKPPKQKSTVSGGSQAAKRFNLEDQRTTHNLCIHFLFDKFDADFSLPIGSSDKSTFLSTIKHFKDYQCQHWGEILNNDRNHPVKIDDISQYARDRLDTLFPEGLEVDELISLRFTGAQRLWGIKQKEKYHVLWWDPNHEVCPSIKK